MFSKSALFLCLLSPVFAGDLVVHEWGTFTSVAGERGEPVSWVSFNSPSDLPCFVYRLNAMCVKCNATSPVRMETPVLYFYTAEPTTVSVHVDLPSGVITEWYPKATPGTRDVTYGFDGKIDWSAIHLLPGATPEFPHDGTDSHYYPARNTEAVPLRVDGQHEKLLFYRGIANQGVSIEAQIFPNGKLELRNTGGVPVPFAMLFENRGGKIGYRLLHGLSAPVSLDFPQLTADVADVHRDLADALTAAGLFPKEAAAMIDTWRDTWFEDGMRVFYILPRTAVDTVLPLKIKPAPATTERVFVGRVEVLSPTIQDTLRTALGSGDTTTLAKFGRFLNAFSDRIRSVTVAPEARKFMDKIRAQNAVQKVAPCKEPVTLPTNQ